jgi:hypothetical protein
MGTCRFDGKMITRHPAAVKKVNKYTRLIKPTAIDNPLGFPYNLEVILDNEKEMFHHGLYPARGGAAKAAALVPCK